MFVSDEVRRRIVSLEKAKESFLEQQASLEKITINNFFQGVEDLLSQWLGNDYASQMTLAARSTLQEAINRRIYSLSTAICKVTSHVALLSLLPDLISRALNILDQNIQEVERTFLLEAHKRSETLDCASVCVSKLTIFLAGCLQESL